jgi:GNAT superfamily N-acetyltransferase
MTRKPHPVIVRSMGPEDFDGIIGLCERVYTESQPWGKDQLESHLSFFAEGQLVAVDPDTDDVVGMAASLIILWDDYDFDMNWRTMTDRGYFTNHDPLGHTLYGAEVMTEPALRRRGIGKALYQARRDLTRRLKLHRIRAGARLRGYHRYAPEMTAAEYVGRVVRGELTDPTLSFQLRQRFRVVAVTEGYLGNDPESLGHSAVIEWLNHDVVKHKDYAGRDRRFLPDRARGPGA